MTCESFSSIISQVHVHIVCMILIEYYCSCKITRRRMISNITFFRGWYFIALVFSVHFGLIRCDDALLFDIMDTMIIQKPPLVGDRSEDICGNCASACPAGTSAEDVEYNYKESIGKKVLFLTTVYDQSVKFKEMNVPECDKTVQPSLVYNAVKGLVETGYEVHDRQKSIQSLPSNKVNRLLSLYPSNHEQKPDPRNVLTTYLKINRDVPNLLLSKISEEYYETSQIIWLPVLSIIFNPTTLSPIQIEYKSDLGTHWWRENCNRFEVGNEFYPEKSLNSFYDHENQKKLFTGIKNEAESSVNINSLSLSEEFDCGQKYGCLVQHQIIPSYYLHSYYGAYAICTFMNTVPVWETISERIKIIDEYLYTMTQLWPSKIRIINRFNGIFKPTEEYFENFPRPIRELFLHKLASNIEVPKIFFKSVTYTLETSKYPEDAKHPTAIIVIHNDPTPNVAKSRICPDEQDKLSGWEAIENDEFSSGLTYVCRLNKYVATELDIPGKGSMPDMDGLSLDEFPTYDFEEKVHSHYNAKLQIEEKSKELFEKRVL